MSHVFLARPTQIEPGPVNPSGPLLALILESLDGQRRIPLDGSTGWVHMPGSTGLKMPPFDVVTSGVPGVPGSVLQDVRVEERRVFIPVFAGRMGATHVEHLQSMDDVRDIVDPLTGMFRIVGVTERGERELTVVYTGGLEGDDSRETAGIVWDKFGLQATACDPFAYDRTPRTVEFQVSPSDDPFLGVEGGTDAPWPGALSSATVIGEGMQIRVDSEVPVFPTLELVGPMDSFAGSMSTGWSVSVPDGVPAGSTLRLVTDPRARSIRLDGALAAGMVARGSTLRPFYPGLNVLDVSAPGGTDETRILLSWREAHRSLW